MMKWSILIGSLSGPNFVIWAAQMDRLGSYSDSEQFQLIFYENGPTNAGTCLTLVCTFAKNGCFNLSAKF